MTHGNALGILGIARRAGKLRFGYGTAVEAMKSGEAKLALLSGELSEKTKKNLRFEAGRCGVPVIETAYTMEEFRGAMGKKTGVLAVCDSGFLERLLRELPSAEEREEFAYDGKIQGQ